MIKTKKEDGLFVSLSIRMKLSLHTKISELSLSENRSMTSMVGIMLDDYFGIEDLKKSIKERDQRITELLGRLGELPWQKES